MKYNNYMDMENKSDGQKLKIPQKTASAKALHAR